MKKALSRLVCAIALGVFASGALAQSPKLQDTTVTVLSLPEQKKDDHWVWVTDFDGGLYARAILFNADTGRMLGSTDIGWEGIKLDFPKSGEVFYNHGMYLARGFRGKRVDVVEIINRKTLSKEGEIEVPPKMIRGWPNPNESALTDDDRFLFLHFFAPASGIGIVDLKQKKFVGEIETAGCGYVMSAGPRQFFTLCGDGSALLVSINDQGQEVSRSRVEKLFDPNVDPLHGTGVRSGNDWYFVTELGQLKILEISGTSLRLKKEFAVGEQTAKRGWVPAEMLQHIAFNQATNSLYVLMADASLEKKGGGTDYHRQAGTEVWVWNVETGKRERRIKLEEPQLTIGVSPGASPFLYTASAFVPKLNVRNSSDGKILQAIDVQQNPVIIQPVAPR